MNKSPSSDGFVWGVCTEKGRNVLKNNAYSYTTAGSYCARKSGNSVHNLTKDNSFKFKDG